MGKILCLIFCTILLLSANVSAGENKTSLPDGDQASAPELVSSPPIEIQLPFNLKRKPVSRRESINCGVERDTWTFTEDFSGDFPGSVWSLEAGGTGSGKGYGWGKTTNNPRSGTFAVWCAEENFAGNSDRTAGVDNYPDNMSTWMIAGPFDVDPYWSIIDLKFYYKASIEYNHDFTFAGISTDGINCVGKYYGSSSSNYKKYTVSTSVNFNHVKNPRVWICIQFASDAARNYKGVWIDDIELSVTSYIYHLANFEATPLAGKAPLEVNFTNICNTPLPNHFTWNYGDGTIENLRESPEQWSNPYHLYTKPGTYSVSLRAWNPSFDETLILPNLIYVDSVLEYCDLKLLDWGRYYRKEGWDNVIDHDIFSTGCKVAAYAKDAWGIFRTADKTDRLISKIRLLTDVVYRRDYRTNCAKDVRISLSRTGKFTGEEIVFQHTCTRLHGEWDEIPVIVNNEPVLAKYIKVEILSARGDAAKYHELVEMQVLGTPVSVPKEPSENLTNRATEKNVDFILSQNYPNPFNPETTIRFSLPEASEVRLAIYNVQGQLVKTLASEQLSAGIHTRIWDARDQSGSSVAGGIYVYKLQAVSQSNRFERVNKMLLMK